MNDYISRNEVLRKFIEGDGNDDFTEGYNFAVNEHREKIKAIPAADVQPVEKWCEYGFEYREPAEYGYYLTYYHGRIHVSEWSVSGWYNETGLPIDDDVVKYWQPLPEPPVTD